MGIQADMNESQFFVRMENAARVAEMLEEQGYAVESDTDGNIIEIEFTGEKVDEQAEQELFCTVAPFVRDGSYIGMTSQFHESWR